MTQVLCYTGKGFNTCWRPSNIATQQVISLEPDLPPNTPPGTYTCKASPFTPVRFQQ